MPTAARLTAAITFAIVGYFIYMTMVPLFGDDVIPTYLLPLCVISGIVCGWVFCGTNAHGIQSGIGTGLTAVIAQAFWILLIMSFVRMIKLSLRLRYDGPMEAVVDVFTIMYDSILLFATPTMGITVLVGGLIAGIVSGFMGKKYPH
ncbi:TrgA family protein [bacterium]|nr:TrgA family protein [bacterium]